MKKELILIVMLSLVSQVYAQKANTTVSGKLSTLPKEEWIYLSGFKSGYRDSVQQTEKGFKFELDISEGEGDFHILQVGKNNYSNGAFIYLEKGKLNIVSKTSLLQDAKFSGGKLANYYNTFQSRPKAEGLEALYKEYSEAQEKKDTEKLKQLGNAITAKNAEQKQLDKAFVLKHRTSPGVVYPLFFSLRDRNNLVEVDSILQQLSPQVKNNLPVKEIEHSIKTDKLTGIGKTALPFSQTDTTGKMVSLQDFRGKYVLIDFWASWCVPCRIENPNVVSAYQQYKNKNFTVLGISFDNPGQRGRWIDAIHADNLHWTQLSDLKGWKNEVGVLYDIKSIPSNILIDPNGVIVAKNLKGEKLEEKLNELLGTPQLDKETFVINGRVENPEQFSWFHIHYQDDKGQSIADSTRIFNGSFSYIGKVKSALQAGAYFKKDQDNTPPSFDKYIQFYIEPAVLSITGNSSQPEEILISGSTTQDEYAKYINLTKEERQSMKPLSEEYQTKNIAYSNAKKQGESEEKLNVMLDELGEIRNKMTPYQTAIRQKQVDYIKQNPNSFISAAQLRFYVNALQLEEVQGIYAQMSEEIKSSPAGKEIAKEIAKVKSGSPGSVAFNFSGSDITGKPLQLTDYRGKYVLLDFWASWCVPCRKGNPHLLDIYSKYKKNGFEIIGISDDDNNHLAWKKAVEQDKIGVWKHVLRGLKRTDGGGFDRSEDKSEHYGIHTLPTKILIDPNGIIVGRYASGAGSDKDLDEKLKEIFKY